MANNKIIQKTLNKRVPSSFIERYRGYFSPVALFTGFIFDNLTLTRIDLLYDNLILFLYLAFACAGIITIQLYKEGTFKGIFLDRIASSLPLFVQFAFGGLFSGYFVFYMRSAALPASWFFMLLILVLLIGNEFFRKKYTQFIFQMSIFYTSLFSFLIFFVPVLVGRFGANIFLFSGVISLLVFSLLYLFFAKITPYTIRRYGSALKKSIFGIYVVINVLYFTNIIPPIPLSLKDIGVYYSVQRIDGVGYEVFTEDRKWYEIDELLWNKIYHSRGTRIYVYSSVFAPGDFSTKIIHSWEYYNVDKDKWVLSNKVEFPVYGGRDGGYRGYSFKENVFSGKWRVSVVTMRGQLIGRESFVVVDSNNIPKLNLKIL